MQREGKRKERTGKMRGRNGMRGSGKEVRRSEGGRGAGGRQRRKVRNKEAE